MKKIAIMFVLILVLIAVSAAAFADTMYSSRSDKQAVKLYNSNDEIIDYIPYRAAVETHSRSRIDENRTEVCYNGQWGWVKTKYLSSSKPPKAETTTKTTTTTVKSENVFKNMKSVNHYEVVVHPSKVGSFVNLRWAPSMSAAVMDVRYEGDVLRVIAKNGTWAQVYDDTTGQCGFMMLSFLEKISE